MKKITVLLFAEGLVSVSVQFLFMRHLLPHVGGSVVVSSIVISIFLLFLAMGYYYGGEKTSGFTQRLSGNFLLSSLFLSFGLSPAVSSAYFAYLTDSIDIHLLLAAYLLLFMAPAVFLLGQTMPLLANCVLAESKGKVSATVLFFSTLGNVIGSLVSVLILMRYAGLGVTVFVNILVLMLLYLWISEEGGVKFLRFACILITSSLTILVIERLYYDTTNQYANYLVLKDDGKKSFFEDKSKNGRFLVANNIIQSATNDSGDPIAYVDLIRRKIEQHSDKPSNVLVLGAGGFSLSSLDHRNKYTFVDIDGNLKNYAEKNFLKKEIVGSFVASDARQFLISNRQKRDIIVLDTFSSTFAVPYHLISKEYFELVRSRVADRGMVLINTIMKKNFGDDYSRRMNHTVNSVFKDCTINDLTDKKPLEFEGSKYTNIVYVCHAYPELDGVFEDRRIREF